MREGPLQGAAEAYAETEYPRTAGWHGLAALAFDQWKVILSSEPELYDVVAESRGGAQPGVAEEQPRGRRPPADCGAALGPCP